MKFKIVLISAVLMSNSALYPMEKNMPESVSLKSEYVNGLIEATQEFLGVLQKEIHKSLSEAQFFEVDNPFTRLMSLQNKLEIQLNAVVQLKDKFALNPNNQKLESEFKNSIVQLHDALKESNEKFQELRRN